MNEEIKKPQPKSLDEVTPVCFWCGKPFHEPTEERPFTYVVNYQPCEKCKTLFGNGIHVVGVSYEPVTKGMFPISKDIEGKPVYPTGSMMVTGEEWVKELLSDPKDKDKLEEVLKQRKMMIPEEVLDPIIKEAKAKDIMKEEE